uniref:EOG090X0OY9 n=1 Tax=Daphnia longispina TaxID=42846 RepID=A0A4Y7MA06_9CRUS|nr:EOG090X0OY9 [Daphnia longispina]
MWAVQFTYVMFHRDPGAGEDLTSDQTFAWPPSGFRDRRSHFGRTANDPTATASASASSSSSPFGHNTAQRKSSDQVIQSLRDELDKHRQMFFDRLAPQWESTAQRGQHNKMGRSDSPSARPRIPKPAARSATGDFPPGSPAASPKSGFCRASSAPPVGPHAADNGGDHNVSSGSPRRMFTTTLNQPQMGNPINSQRENQATDSPGLGRRHPNIHHHHSSSSGGGTSNNVRHIPIMVEGRDEPLLPSVAEEGVGQFSAAEKRSKTAIPMPFYPTTEKMAAPSSVGTTQIPISVLTTSTPSTTDKTVKQNQEEVRDASVPIPLPYDRLSDDSGKSAGSSASVDLQTANDLELIERIQRETETLLPRIEEFRGDRHDRGFLFLDEMLTRLLLKLDNVQVEGRDDVRVARRQAIASITRCINLLESKLLHGIERSDVEGEAATVNNNSQQQQSQPAVVDEPMIEGECINDIKAEEEQPNDVVMSDANNLVVPPSPTRHVTQLMINIKEPTCAPTETNEAPVVLE